MINFIQRSLTWFLVNTQRSNIYSINNIQFSLNCIKITNVDSNVNQLDSISTNDNLIFRTLRHDEFGNVIKPKKSLPSADVEM